jgi:dUTP pyrophosphatase
MRFFEEVEAKHKKYDSETILPKRADKASAGYDLRIKEDVTLKPGESVLVFTDIKVFMPENEVLLVYIRSSLGVKYGINLMNGTGVIDSSYYNNPSNGGNIGIPLVNTGDKTVMLLAGERCAQAIFMPFLLTNDDEVVNDFREGGFGSSGRD